MGALSKRSKRGDLESPHNTDDESDCQRVMRFASKTMKQDYIDEENSVPEEDDTSEDEMDEDEDDNDLSDAGQNGRQMDEEMDELEKQYQNLRSEEQNLLKNLKRQKDEDVVKGQAVKNQKVLWDKTLELRFLLQKTFPSSNKLPQEPVKSLFCSSAQDVDQAYSELTCSARQTLNSILELQEVLLEKNPPILQDSTENYKDDALYNLKEDNDKEWLQISNMHSRIIPFRNSSIDKWHRKTQVISGAAAFRGKLQAFNQNISEQVAGYMRDPSRMIRRMQLSGSSVGVFGKIPEVSETETLKKEANVAEGNVDGDPELIDDSEFYSQLLKEFLESNLSSSETAYYALRKLQPKKRKVVDRRASKSRKIRYHVHEKIVNFMAPVPMVLPAMTPKLFENLFGLNKEKSNSGI